MLQYLSDKNVDNMKVKERSLALEERRLEIEEKKIALEEKKWEYLLQQVKGKEL